MYYIYIYVCVSKPDDPQKVGSPRPFNHIFAADRILEHDIQASKNAGPRKRAQGRAQGVLSYQNLNGIFANPHIFYSL